MIPYKSLLCCTLFLFLYQISIAQRTVKRQKLLPTERSNLIYDNINYVTAVKSVSILPAENENSFPILSLGKDNFFHISFDDLRADMRSLYYSLTHCNADWTPSRLSTIDYLSGYEEDRIYNIQSSENTNTPYTNYSFTFPNENIQPKIAGNYLLKVYEDGDKARLLWSRKIYVMENKTNIDIELMRSLLSQQKNTNQKLNLTINSSVELVNPTSNLQIHTFQNQRTDNSQILKNPTQISPHIVSYHDVKTLDFKGNNEFRRIDLRSIRSASTNIKELNRDSSIHAVLVTDNPTAIANYSRIVDENGKFYIRNLDFEKSATQSEYIFAYFSLKDSANIKGDIYLVGGFNNYNTSAENKMTYNPQSKTWENVQLLKQGVYNYEYLLKDEDKISTDRFAGSHYETENDYQILIYYRKPGTYWDEIIGFKNYNKTKQ